MPHVTSSIEYLQKLPLYETEKPYWCMLTPRDGFDPDEERLDNLEFETRDRITITDIRSLGEEPSISTCGFEVMSHESSVLAFESENDVQACKKETELLLMKVLGAEFVKTYELRSRKNIPIERQVFNIADPLLVEGPARGAHNGT
jgi:hypothetical protein